MTSTHTEIREGLAAFDWTHVYIIYAVDVLGDATSGVEQFNPANHVLAGWGEGYRPEARVHAAEAAQAFSETEADDQWPFDYLASESHNPRFRGVDSEDEMKCERCGATLVYKRDLDTWVSWDDDESDACPDSYLDADADYTGEDAGEDRHIYAGRGRHRKWVGQLTRHQWREFAGAYCIDLDDNDLPDSFELTLGSLTEHGHLDAISIDVSEGWESPGGVDYGDVMDANMYVSFGRTDG